MILRRFRAEDLHAFHAYRADPEVARFQGWSDFTLDDATRFIETQAGLVPGALGVGAQIAVVSKASGEMIGDVFLATPEDDSQQARIGYTFARQHQGRGLATEAVRTLLDYVFRVLDKRRVTATTFASNERSVALLERIGMRREAHHVQSALLEEAWADEYVYALLRHEWPR